MNPTRRIFLTTAGVTVAIAGTALSTAPAAHADFISAPDVVVYCDPALTNPLRAVGADFRARTGVAVRVFGAPGTLQLALLARGTRNDVLVTLVALMDEAARRSLVKPDTRAGRWRDQVVLAARDAVANEQPLDPPAFARLLGDGRVAVIDPVDVDRMDGPAALRQLGWAEFADGRVDGMPTGQEVAFSVANGTDRLGLMHRSDLSGHRNLRVVGLTPAAIAGTEYTAAIGHNVLSRYATDFLAYLLTPEATARLRAEGLEVVS